MKKHPKRELKFENIKWEYDVVYKRYYTYVDLFEDFIAEFKKEVNMKCSEGWIPEGEMNIMKDEKNDNIYFCQTIIRPIINTNVKESNITLSDKMEIRPASDDITLSDRMEIRPAYDNITLSNEF